MTSVTIDRLTVTYPDGTVGAREVSLDIADGEFLALVGPSGSGKTTLLRALAGFLPAGGGSVHIGGADVTALPPERREIGMVFQQHAVWPHMSVAANVGYPLRVRGVRGKERSARVEEALERVGLAGLGARRPATLSGGQRQRVALARALVARPRVLLLDEALSALDEPLRDALRKDLLRTTRDLGLTVVHVTHDRTEALALADRVAVLDGGSLQQVGAPAELVTRPSSPFVARFIADGTTVPARLGAEGLRCDNGWVVPGQHVEVADPVADSAAPDGIPGTAVVLPDDVVLSTTAGPELAGVVLDARAEVGVSLFTRQGADVALSSHATPVRAYTTGLRPEPHDRLTLAVRRVWFYPEGPGD